MAKLILVLGDQLSPALPGLRGMKSQDRVLMVEVASEACYTLHHKQKIILIFSAMRHFAAVLQQQGIAVSYMDYQQKVSSLTEAVAIVLKFSRTKSGAVIRQFPNAAELSELVL